MTSKIFSANPGADYLAVKDEIDQAINKVMLGGRYILGEEVNLFESEFSQYIGVNYAVAVASGTDALVLSLLAVGVMPGDEVITVSHTAVATVSAIVQCQAKPVFVDINENTFTIDASKIEKAITKKTRAIIAVHLYGHPVDLHAVQLIADKYQLSLVEDCAQAHGAEYHGKKVGSIGEVGAFSFYPTKNLGAVGDGGLIVTRSKTIEERIRMLREYGWKHRYISEFHGMNSRLDEIQAAVLRVKLKYLDRNNEKRRKIAEIYNSALDHLLAIPVQLENVKHVYHLFVVRSRHRDELLDFMMQKNIFPAIHYPLPVHLQPAYLAAEISLPVTEAVAGQILSLPMYPQLMELEIERVCECIQDFFHGR